MSGWRPGDRGSLRLPPSFPLMGTTADTSIDAETFTVNINFADSDVVAVEDFVVTNVPFLYKWKSAEMQAGIGLIHLN